MWKHFHHEADVGIRGTGATPAEAFIQAGLALTAVITDPEQVRCRDSITLRCQDDQLELLFVDWLNALVYEMSTRKMLFGRFDVKIENGHLVARVWGEPVDVERHEPATEVKGATYTALEVCQDENSLWHAQCVVDV